MTKTISINAGDFWNTPTVQIAMESYTEIVVITIDESNEAELDALPEGSWKEITDTSFLP